MLINDTPGLGREIIIVPRSTQPPFAPMIKQINSVYVQRVCEHHVLDDIADVQQAALCKHTIADISHLH